jgi:hypothetical protein
MTRARPDQTVPPTSLKFDCGHLIVFTISPPRVGSELICPSCRLDDPPRRVIEKIKTEARLHRV